MRVGKVDLGRVLLHVLLPALVLGRLHLLFFPFLCFLAILRLLIRDITAASVIIALCTVRYVVPEGVAFVGYVRESKEHSANETAQLVHLHKGDLQMLLKLVRVLVSSASSASNRPYVLRDGGRGQKTDGA